VFDIEKGHIELAYGVGSVQRLNCLKGHSFEVHLANFKCGSFVLVNNFMAKVCALLLLRVLMFLGIVCLALEVYFIYLWTAKKFSNAWLQFGKNTSLQVQSFFCADVYFIYLWTATELFNVWLHFGENTSLPVHSFVTADRDFNLISDVGLNVNAHFIGQDGTETGFDGTWMSALGFTWSEGNTVRTATITVKQVSSFTPSQKMQSSA
jgi:hypothetical protein